LAGDSRGHREKKRSYEHVSDCLNGYRGRAVRISRRKSVRFLFVVLDVE